MWKACLLASALVACTDLPPVAAGECGNQVIEPAREDCDVLPDLRHGPGLTCDRCRYVCDPTAPTPACPPSWGCGRDGMCRHGVARFIPASGEPPEFPATVLVAGDRDGDRAIEVTGAALTRVGRLAGVERAFDAELNITTGNALLAMTDLDLDGLADLLRSLRGVNGRAGVRGAESRPMLAVQKLDTDRTTPGIQLPDPHTKLIAIRTDADPAHREVFAWLPGASLTWIRIDDSLAAPVVLPGVGGTPTSFMSPVVGNIDLAVARSGDEVVLAHQGALALYVVRMDPDPVLIKTITVAQPLARAPVLGDIDDDGDLDIVAPVQGATGIVGAVALGDGLGGFAAATIDPRFSAATVMPCNQGASPRVGGVPLLIADVDGNGTSDYVTAGGLVLRHPTAAGYCAAASVTGTEAVIDAVVLDMTGDGLLDAAWITGDTFVRLVIGQGSGLFEQRMINIAGASTSLDAGTFDWDTYDDLLVGEVAAGGATAFEVIKGTNVANTDRVLPAPRVPGLASLAIGPLGERSDSLIDDLVIFGIDDVSGHGYVARIAVTVEGDTFLSELPGPVLSSARFIAAGDLDGSGRRDDVIALFEDPTGATRLRVWPDQTWYLSDRAVRSSMATGIPATSAATLADLEGDGIDELVFSVGGEFKVFDLRDLDRGPQTLVGAPADSLVRLPRPDGDCLVTISTLAGASVLCPLDPGTSPIIVTTAAALGGAAANLDEDPELEIIVVTTAGVEAYDIDATAANLIVAITVGPGASPVAVCPADLDGDAVTDLVVGSGATVEVLWGVAHDGGPP